MGAANAPKGTVEAAPKPGAAACCPNPPKPDCRTVHFISVFRYIDGRLYWRKSATKSFQCLKKDLTGCWEGVCIDDIDGKTDDADEIEGKDDAVDPNDPAGCPNVGAAPEAAPKPPKALPVWPKPKPAILLGQIQAVFRHSVLIACSNARVEISRAITLPTELSKQRLRRSSNVCVLQNGKSIGLRFSQDFKRAERVKAHRPAPFRNLDEQCESVAGKQRRHEQDEGKYIGSLRSVFVPSLPWCCFIAVLSRIAFLVSSSQAPMYLAVHDSFPLPSGIRSQAMLWGQKKNSALLETCTSTPIKIDLCSRPHTSQNPSLGTDSRIRIRFLTGCIARAPCRLCGFSMILHGTARHP